MRLADLLGRAPDTTAHQVERFLHSKRVGWGQHRNIDAGQIIRNYFCLYCGDARTFFSSKLLSCLITSSESVSIDASLKCSACQTRTEAWFLVGADDVFGQAPTVRIERYTEHRGDTASDAGSTDQVDDLLERAQIAHDDRLGAGSMVYLRKVFEISTVQAANAIGVSTKTGKGARKRFRDLLKEVDQESGIVPREFSSNSYQLFSELSEVMHGSADEGVALTKYAPCRRLVIGIIDNIRNNNEMSQAVVALGWKTGANA